MTVSARKGAIGAQAMTLLLNNLDAAFVLLILAAWAYYEYTWRDGK